MLWITVEGILENMSFPKDIATPRKSHTKASTITMICAYPASQQRATFSLPFPGTRDLSMLPDQEALMTMSWKECEPPGWGTLNHLSKRTGLKVLGERVVGINLNDVPKMGYAIFGGFNLNDLRRIPDVAHSILFGYSAECTI